MSGDDLLDPTRDTTEEATDNRPEYPVVGDEENIAQKRSHQRVQAILDEITNTRIKEANDVDGEISPAGHRRAYLETVKELWTELRPTLKDADDSTEEYYWYQIDLGQWEITPPRVLTEPQSRQEAESRPDLAPGGQWATADTRHVTGFQQFNQMNATLRTRFSVLLDEDQITVPELRQRMQQTDPNHTHEVHPRSGKNPREPFRVDKITLIPKYVIDNARSALRELAEEAQIGFGKPDAIGEEETDPV